MNETKVFGDGDNLFLFWKEGTNEVVYTFRHPLITGVNMEQPSNYDFVNVLGSNKEINIDLDRPPLDVKIEFKVMHTLPNGDWGFKVESDEKGGLMKGLDMFQNVSVSQLFRVINKKLNKRSAKHK